MPRFTEQEKEIISNKLLIEGEKLFALHGLKKVTVDDLVAAVNISKGSFYAFYPSKEHLYVEINFRLQKELFASIEATIKKKKYKNHRDLAKDVIMLSLTGLITSPILSQIGDTGKFRSCIFGPAYGSYKIFIFCFILHGTIQRG